MQPNQPDFDPSQPVAQPQPQTQPAAPQYENPAPQPQPYQAPVAVTTPFEALVVTSPIDNADNVVPPAQPTTAPFAPSPVEPGSGTINAAPQVSSPSPAPALAQKTSHKALFIILAAIIGLIIVVAGVYLAVTLTGSSS